MHINKVDKFITEEGLLSKGDTVIVAVSGGADSLCLLSILKALTEKYDLKIIVAHLNHCLRPEAKQEEIGVSELSANMNLIFETREADIKKLKRKYKVSEEVAGRSARYRFLLDVANRYKANKIALGHHMDDQAETVLLNILRGTGIDGLSGILPKTSRGRVILVRPLLCLKRYEIEEYCAQQGLKPYTDSSNLELIYTRNKVRLKLMPYLEKEYNPNLKEGLNNLSRLALYDRLYFKRLVQTTYNKIAIASGNKIIIKKNSLHRLPKALLGRIIHYTLQSFRTGFQFSYTHIRQVMKLCGDTGSAGPVFLPGNLYVYSLPDLILFSRGALRKNADNLRVALRMPGKTSLGNGSYLVASIKKKNELIWPPRKSVAYLDSEKVKKGNILVSFRWPGARFHPQGAPGSKKLKDFFIDQKIPEHKRASWPLVAMDDTILWVAGLRIHDNFKVSEKTEDVLVLKYYNTSYKA